MPKKNQFIFWPLIALLALVSPSIAAGSAQDAEIGVNPVVHYFPATAFGATSATAVFTVSNQGSSSLNLGSLVLSGADADQFVLGANRCSLQELLAGQSCEIEVSYRPTRRGTVTADLLIPSSDSETPILTAFVSNHEAEINEVQRRMPPVLTSISIPEAMQASIPNQPAQTYPLSWSMEGYHENFLSMIVLYDCTDVAEGSCGNQYDDINKIAESGMLSAASVTAGKWVYNGVPTRQFHFSWDFEVPSTRADGSAWATEPGTDIVVRFFRSNNIDMARNNSKVSLLIPGNHSTNYYDTEGRRVIKMIVQGN